MDAQLKSDKLQAARERADKTVSDMRERRDQRLADAIHGSPSGPEMTVPEAIAAFEARTAE
jgi:hypothetical protein